MSQTVLRLKEKMEHYSTKVLH